MKAWRWIILLILVTLASYHFYDRQKPSSKESLPISAPPAAAVVSPATTSSVAPIAAAPTLKISEESMVMKPLAKQQATHSRFSEKPKDLFVQFEVVDGYAVAFGDTVLGKPMKDFHEKVGSAEVRPPMYWPRSEVPYAISSDLPNPERVNKTIELFHQKTNIRFVPYRGQRDAVIFTKGESNCASYLGRVGEVQPIFLSEKCDVPEISHELMHALGFIHEQSRLDRDEYINILWNNIDSPFQSQFAMVPEALMDSLFDSPFNSNSIMMYEAHMFATAPGLETIQTKSGTSITPPPRTLSETDIARINRLYPRMDN